MKKIFVSMGLAAVGTASLQAAYAPDLTSLDSSKTWGMWNVSATLRGFYDDNYATSGSGGQSGSVGFEFSPSLNVYVPLQQTELGLRYTYGLYYYQEREQLGQTPIDQTHQIDLWVDHAFSERWRMRIADTFAVAQEPELLSPGGVVSVPGRVEGNNIVNSGTITLHTDWTRQFSTELGYQNGFYDYENSGATVTYPTPLTIIYDPNPPHNPIGIIPGSPGSVDSSLAGLLNRIEQSAWLNLQWQVQPETMVLAGGRFGLVNYTGDEPVAIFSPGPYYSSYLLYHSSDRDNRSYFGYVGFSHVFLPNLFVSFQGGVQYTESYNDPLSSPSLAPYVVMSASYTYSPGNYAQVGFTQSRNATDVIAPDASGRITQDQETSVLYASLNHHFTPKLLGTLIGHLQYSTFNEGAFANEAELFYNFGLNLSYTINPHLSADVGYNFDYLSSQIPGRTYQRNRAYVGFTAAY
jgi:hypothetical protein